MPRGPQPKTDTRQRKAKPVHDWVDLEPLDSPVLAPLDELATELGLGEVVWHAASRMMWDAWRDDPATQMWNATDRALAVDLIMLHNEAAVAKAPEIRIRMNELGLGPKGRQDRRWRLPNEEALADEPVAAPTPLRVLPEAK